MTQTNTSENHSANGPEVLPAQAARQGVQLGHVRYVLSISLVLAIAAMAVAYFWFGF